MRLFASVHPMHALKHRGQESWRQCRQDRFHGGIRHVRGVMRAIGLALATLLLLDATGAAAKSTQKKKQPLESRTKTRTGEVRAGHSLIGWEKPIVLSESMRNRVRGDRPASASIHVAYAPAVRDPDELLRAHLAQFEREHLPDEPPIARTTIVSEAPDAWMRSLAKPDLPVRWNRGVVEYLRYFKEDPKGRRLIGTWLERMGRYDVSVRRILREVGVPEDLVYVAMVESGFNPAARSRVGAAGMWQFMAPTGRVYGLTSDYWHDNRLDVERSTFAAASYLKDLHTRFGSWELALAAYNAGYGLVVKTIRENNTNNYWALCEIENGLPRQTSNYVAKVIAAALAGHNTGAFGLSIDMPEPMVTTPVRVPPGTRVVDVAKALDVDSDQLKRINARLSRGRTDPGAAVKNSIVLIPRDKMSAFEHLGPKLRDAIQDFTTYRVRLGEGLPEIAARFGTTTRKLRRINSVHDSGEVGSGVVLLVPRVDPSAPLPGDAAKEESNRVPLVAVPAIAIPKEQILVFFQVTRASTPGEIASRFAVPWEHVVAWNDLDPQARLVTGQYLQLLLSANFNQKSAGVRIYRLDEVTHVLRGSRKHLDALLKRKQMRRRGYKARKGDTVARIAKRFKMSQGSLARINGIGRNQALEPGQVVVIYVPAQKTKGTILAPDPAETTLTAEIKLLNTSEPASEGAPASTAKTSKLPGRIY